jgi:hypothetical protein
MNIEHAIWNVNYLLSFTIVFLIASTTLAANTKSASMGAYLMYVPIDATQKTGSKTSKMVEFVFATILRAGSHPAG